MIRVLSIDGGGIRGLIPATILAAMEARAGRPVAQMFDLVAGTSTGGILGLALVKPGADGRPTHAAASLVELYAARGREIFHRSFWRGVATLGGLAEERYSHAPLEAVLQEYLGEALLRDALLPTMITTYDIERRDPFFFKSWRDDRNGVPMWQAARATSAAPIYFEPALLEVGGKRRALVDGGVFINNPALSAYAEARRRFPDERDFVVVSLGTGELTRPIAYDDARTWGAVQWALPLLGVIFDGVADAVDYQLRALLGDRYFRFQTLLDMASDDLDNASAANVDALRREAQQILVAQASRLDPLLELLAG
jgi:uncharacterized protein